MVVERTVLGILMLALLVCSAGAYDLSPSTISSSEPGWLIAHDPADTSIITVYALNAGSPPTPVGSANVSFSLDPASEALGTLSPASPVTVQTGPDGKATTVFTAKQKSGTAIIRATISVLDAGITTPVTISTTQKIDHDTPRTGSITGPSEAPVGSIVTVTAKALDRWGNVVDNKNVAETLTLNMVTAGGSGFQDGSNYVSLKTYPVDDQGNATAIVRISSSVTDSNYIQMDPIGNIVIPPDKYIVGVADSKVWYITQTPASPGSLLPANGAPENQVQVYYYAYDQYYNPIPYATIFINSTDGMTLTAPTNQWGKVWFGFGPKDIVGYYTLTAVALDNATAVCLDDGTIGYCDQTVRYYNTDPVDLTLTANPQAMTSLDVNPGTKALLQARVIDTTGNAVIGETVNFALGTSTFAPFDQTIAPSLSASSATVGGTDSYAKVEFYPGMFATGGATYNGTATGEVNVTASWVNKEGVTITRDVKMVYKNYPYLSTSSLGDCGNSQVGDKVNITIRLFGDGAALRPKPIDVILLNDRSGSMLQGGTPDRMVSAKGAGSLFFSQLTPGTDKFGLVSFGDTRWAKLAPDYVAATNSWSWSNVYSSGYWVNEDARGPYGYGWDNSWDTPDCPGCDFGETSIDHYSTTSAHHQYIVGNYNGGVAQDYGSGSKYHEDLAFGSHTQAEVDAALHTIVPSGNTPIREGVYRAVNMLPATTPDRVRAVILLTDGEYNTGNDPEGITDNGQTWFTAGDLAWNDNVFHYAKDREVKVYVIGLSITSSSYRTKLQRYANTTGAKYFNAEPSELAGVYTAIAGDLRQTAGANTEVAIDFGTIKIDDGAGTAKDYMDYVWEVSDPIIESSTYINKTKMEPDGSLTPIYNYVQDDRSNWSANNFAFKVGTINLNETWSATFRLNMTKAAKIDMFGPGSSTIKFTDAASNTTQTGFIPAMQCRVRENIVNLGFGTKSLAVDNLILTPSALDPNVWSFTWNTDYDGEKNVLENLVYRYDGGSWKTVPGAAFTITNHPLTDDPSAFTLSATNDAIWIPAKCYQFQVVGGAEDANPARSNIVQQCKAASVNTIFIKLD